ncbi:MAG TPA: aspartate/glutamate racemase family protein [Steroidobacteraceae bacterium]|nr:aspartate/glutamate racemase family protein [Steroidobacteraceae bacterium]
MRTHIELITPIITEGIRDLDEVRPFERPDLTITHTLIQQGPASIESEFDEALSVPDTIRKAIDAQSRGANAIIIDCMGDPGLHACREVVTIPVIGPSQTAMHIGSLLGHRFSFVTVLDRLRAMVGKLVASYGLSDNYASFRAVDIPVLDIGHDLGVLNTALAREATAAVKEDGADVIVLGCTGFLGCATAMRSQLLAAGCDVPVIDPIPLAVHVADALVKAGLSHSKRTYPEPGRKGLAGYPFPEYSAD